MLIYHVALLILLSGKMLPLSGRRGPLKSEHFSHMKNEKWEEEKVKTNISEGNQFFLAPFKFPSRLSSGPLNFYQVVSEQLFAFFLIVHIEIYTLFL